MVGASNGRASAGPLLAYHYNSLNGSDYLQFRSQYATTNTRAYGKANLTNDTCASDMGCAVSSGEQGWPTTISSVYISTQNTSVVIQVDVPGVAVSDYGACQHVFVEVAPSVVAPGAVKLAVDVTTVGKTPTRIPEFQRLTFSPAAVAAVQVDKLGTQVDALDVVSAGGVHLHGVGAGGVALQLQAGTQVRAISIDTSLVSVGRATAFPTPLTPLVTGEMESGVHFVIHDNLWDTNYPAWYPWLEGVDAQSQMGSGDDLFRFTFEYGPA